MTYKEMFEEQLTRHGIYWCQGGCGSRSSHKRGFVRRGMRTVHLDSKIATRSSLYRGLHEVGHIVMHGQRNVPLRWKRELEAEQFARKKMRELGVAVPRKDVSGGTAYVGRMKRWGDHVRAGLKARKVSRSVVRSEVMEVTE